MIKVSIFLLGFLFTSQALAGCPTKSDLETGIILTRNEPFFSNLNVAANENIVIEKRIINRDGDFQFATIYFHFGLLSIKRVTEQVTIETKNERRLADFFPLKIGSEWKSPVSVYQNGILVGAGTEYLIVKDQGEFLIGECIYNVFQILSSLTIGSATPINFSNLYSSELGLILRSTRLDENWMPVSQVAFDVISAFNAD